VAEIIYIRETDSTNNYLKQLLLEQRLEEGTVVLTDFQSAGRGQRGSRWESEAGKNLLFSILLYPEVKANEQFIISQIVSLAVADSLLSYTNDIAIKWPNDIYWKERKICGILIENVLDKERISQSIAGIGININQTKFAGNAPNPVSLRQITGEEHKLPGVLDKIKANILSYNRQLKAGNSIAIRQHYKNLLFRCDDYHLYNDGTEYFTAKIKDVEPSGLLVLETKEGVEKRFAFKKVKYIL
jgi:BirA family biotin operon repressor/biotin-[acetyl-CoA-carboxylase] ligase